MHADVPIRVTPRSSRQKITVESGHVKAWVMASPTDGQANEAVCKLLASALGIARSRVQIIRGETSREKVLRVQDISLEDALQRLTNTEQ